MVRIDRVSGKRVFGGMPNNEEPKASVIWEAFKPDTEPRRTIHQEELTTKEAVLDALRRARAARHGPAAAPEGGEEGFVEEQGGIY